MTHFEVELDLGDLGHKVGVLRYGNPQASTEDMLSDIYHGNTTFFDVLVEFNGQDRFVTDELLDCVWEKLCDQVRLQVNEEPEYEKDADL